MAPTMMKRMISEIAVVTGNALSVWRAAASALAGHAPLDALAA